MDPRATARAARPERAASTATVNDVHPVAWILAGIIMVGVAGVVLYALGDDADDDAPVVPAGKPKAIAKPNATPNAELPGHGSPVPNATPNAGPEVPADGE